MQLAPAGDRAVLLELGDVTAEELHAWNACVRALPGVVRSIPGHSSLYVIFDTRPDFTQCHPERSEGPVRAGRQHLIPVAFQGPDLDEFLQHAHLTRNDFLDKIGSVRLIARYLGFRAGFAYLDGWPPEWSMPRRPTSRPVARGSFAIAGNVAAFYPIDTPGGWNILGITDMDLENAFEPGDEIRIVNVGRGFSPPPPRRGGLKPRPTLEHAITAPLAIWTDRPFDEPAAALANRAVGNDPHAPLLECPMAGPRIRFAHDAAIAWCTPDLQVSIERVKEGEERTFGRVTGGLRAYLAIGARIESGDSGRRTPHQTIRAMNGPHDRNLTSVECEVTPQLDRVGIRLRPLHPLNIPIPADLKSIGMQCGTVQLHPDGSLVAMGPDHPVTGGYLQPMTVLSGERWKLAQLVPGERVTFVLNQPPNS